MGRSPGWFEKLAGFCETNYGDTRAKLKVDDSGLQSLISGASYGIGELERVPLQVMRERVKSAGGPLGRLKALEAAYEAMMAAAVLNARRRAFNVVLLTELGAGAFGNDPAWVHAAMRRALEMMSGFGLDVKLVSYRSPSQGILRMAKNFS